jgi:hypothetical protein
MPDTELIDRLRALGDALAFDDAQLVDGVLGRIDGRRQSGARRWLLTAAAVLLAVLIAVAVIPDSRRAVARWFGLEGVTVEVDPDVTGTADPVTFDLPGPGESQVTVVAGRPILVSTVDGTLSPRMITKSVQSTTQIEQVDVSGAPGLWIAGAAHEIGYESPLGNPVFERMAGDTLLWQRGDVITRVEGFDDLEAALAFARDLESNNNNSPTGT